ncbi:VOC family protein [Staphylococcus argenteus]|uniref:VOC family protein n=1 Tax=Staphylococcus argenteus TaxID=985002 RepID=UPI0005087FE6|nr:VOC family protein [Staphylococcus argenteus]MBE2133053.1 VOC family protein [Staphylococcus argenteus]MBE2136532.1 VOC family protein [Staphylococcus argenteus]MBE2147069.1 VOC family protein [Staphylococcus argenteus]MBE2161807.1 VOC family protein [Staphylococcus argenteus]MCG9797844.1 VOC family protein [Staphylococcus argenteus]
MIQSMWFNLHVQDLEKSEQFYRLLGFEINKNPQMLDKMVGIQIGQTTVILIENNHFEKVSQQSVDVKPNEVMISLGVKTNEEVDRLVNKVKEAGGTVVQEPTVSQGFYGAMFKDLDGHHFNFLVC